MSEVLKILSSVRTLRVQIRKYILETLEEILGKLEVVVNKRREGEGTTAVGVGECARKLQRCREILITDGIDPSELLNSPAAARSGTRARHAQHPARCSRADENGEAKAWTG